MKWLVLLLALTAAPAQAETILTAHPAAEALARRLTAGTSIQVAAVQPEKLPPSRLASYFAGRGRAALQEAAKSADAVLTFASFWPEDPLYPAARRANIRIVPIDAAQPLDERMPGMAMLPPSDSSDPLYAELGLQPMPPQGEETAPWLSPSRLAEMAEVTAGDLSRLFPAEAGGITQNLSGLKRDLLTVKAEADQVMARRDSVEVVALSPQLGYLAADLGLDLRATIIAAAAEWTDQRAGKLGAWMRGEGISTVLTTRDLPDPLRRALIRDGIEILQIDAATSGDPAGLAGRNIAVFGG